MTTTLLMLADGRFPAGAHAHSAGLEAAVAAGRISDLAGLEAFLRGRLATAGLVAAAFAVAAHRAVRPDPGTTTGGADPGAATPPATPTAEDEARAGPAGPDTRREASARLAVLDEELDARTAAPALRAVSRRQGRALLRAGRSIWPGGPFAALPAGEPHQPIALGLVGAAAGLTGPQVALVATHGAVTGPAGAAVRLLGLDPYHVQALLMRLAADCDRTADAAFLAAQAPPAQLPAAAAPLADLSAEVHATWEVRLFAS